MNVTPDRWTLASTAAAALAVDPAGLHGMVIRDRAGPVRDALLGLLTKLTDRPLRRLPGTLDQTALYPSIDLGETLRTGKEIWTDGLIGRCAGSIVLVPMAERMASGVAAGLTTALDGDDAPALVLLDEAAEPDEIAPEALIDRLAISLSLEGLPFSIIGQNTYTPHDIQKARALLVDGIDDGEAAVTLVSLAAQLGITSLRAPMMALRLARVLAALDRNAEISDEHISLVTLLCLAPRATVIPASEEQTDEAPPPPQDDPKEDGDKKSSEEGPLEDQVLEAIAAALPDLALTGARQRGGANSSGSGDRKKSASQGRPVRSRPGKPEGKRLDVFATLLTAAPWQPLRRKAAPDRPGLIVVPDDFRIKQYDRPAESVLIFLVDASGSQAAARMAEAKGAIELMLAEAYRRREKVAMIAFRGEGADLILPPTRSLLQAKRRLAVLPGGGPTPLATALVAGRELATQIRRRGATPYLVVLTDGRGNIDLNGKPGRAQAAEDQKSAACAIAADGITAALIDTANRPQADAQTLAKSMAARYLPLPRADAKGISKIVRASVAV